MCMSVKQQLNEQIKFNMCLCAHEAYIDVAMLNFFVQS